ncbi:hypothetical protein FNV43_RR14145 [Rhamnella rubrinervis]|uniref:Uncharacterized protein n=1 Tax=Rhamnella rubrinervis TaxID=2594499 RepID=A0A8K0H2I0_9ROSA|nr:hypothetical protein FNV43_RR14145 [Rhamnella rubrinervis]
MSLSKSCGILRRCVNTVASNSTPIGLRRFLNTAANDSKTTPDGQAGSVSQSMRSLVQASLKWFTERGDFVQSSITMAAALPLGYIIFVYVRDSKMGKYKEAAMKDLDRQGRENWRKYYEKWEQRDKKANKELKLVMAELRKIH